MNAPPMKEISASENAMPGVALITCALTFPRQ